MSAGSGELVIVDLNNGAWVVLSPMGVELARFPDLPHALNAALDAALASSNAHASVTFAYDFPP